MYVALLGTGMHVLPPARTHAHAADELLAVGRFWSKLVIDETAHKEQGKLWDGGGFYQAETVSQLGARALFSSFSRCPDGFSTVDEGLPRTPLPSPQVSGARAAAGAQSGALGWGPQRSGECGGCGRACGQQPPGNGGFTRPFPGAFGWAMRRRLQRFWFPALRAVPTAVAKTHNLLTEAFAGCRNGTLRAWWALCPQPWGSWDRGWRLAFLSHRASPGLEFGFGFALGRSPPGLGAAVGAPAAWLWRPGERKALTWQQRCFPRGTGQRGGQSLAARGRAVSGAGGARQRCWGGSSGRAWRGRVTRYETVWFLLSSGAYFSVRESAALCFLTFWNGFEGEVGTCGTRWSRSLSGSRAR